MQLDWLQIHNVGCPNHLSSICWSLYSLNHIQSGMSHACLVQQNLIPVGPSFWLVKQLASMAVSCSIHFPFIVSLWLHRFNSLYLLENFLTIISFFNSNPLLSVSHHQNLCRNHYLQFNYHLMLQSAFLHCKLSGHRAALNFILSSLMITLLTALIPLIMRFVVTIWCFSHVLFTVRFLLSTPMSLHSLFYGFPLTHSTPPIHHLWH